jgi:hypothetical protein
MKLKDLRKTVMNTIMGELKKKGPQSHAELVIRLLPVCAGINQATLSAALTVRLEELEYDDYVHVWPAGTWDDMVVYEASDRMYNANGDWIGHTLINPEWPS